MRNGFPELANQAKSLRSRLAPRLSEFDTKRYFTPSASRRSSQPEPRSEGYKSPWPGGHHSSCGFSGQTAGRRVFASTFGTWFCINSSDGPAPASGYFFRKSRVSWLVLKLFIRRKRNGTL